MGFVYRKSVSLGPFRVNLSKSGVGLSVGGKGFRTGLAVAGGAIRPSEFPERESAIGRAVRRVQGKDAS